MAGERVSAIHCSARTINVYNVLRKLTQSVIAAVRMLFAFSSTLVVVVILHSRGEEQGARRGFTDQ